MDDKGKQYIIDGCRSEEPGNICFGYRSGPWSGLWKVLNMLPKQL